MSFQPFFMVWRPGTGMPTKKHPDLCGAKTEAARLAEKHPGESFYVLQSVTVFSGAVTVTENPAPAVVKQTRQFEPGIF